jgi:serine/threonine protein kinase
VHGDIKPSNVLVAPDGEISLTDVGVPAQRSGPDAEHRGPSAWAPPEVLDGRSDGSGASDVYSLGATNWSLLIGRSPFWVPDEDDSPRALSARILYAPPPYPATRRPARAGPPARPVSGQGAGASARLRAGGRGGRSHLTNGTTATVHDAAPLCLQVRLTRTDRPPSGWASASA